MYCTVVCCCVVYCFFINSVIRTGSLKLVQDTLDVPLKFEYRAESNFFASMEKSDHIRMDRSDDQDRYQERNSASSGEFNAVRLLFSWN